MIATEQAKAIFEWVKDPERRSHWRKVFAESRAYGIDHADCTYIIFSETHLAARSLESKLSRALKDAGWVVSAQAIELVAGWLVGEWWNDATEGESAESGKNS